MLSFVLLTRLLHKLPFAFYIIALSEKVILRRQSPHRISGRLCHQVRPSTCAKFNVSYSSNDNLAKANIVFVYLTSKLTPFSPKLWLKPLSFRCCVLLIVRLLELRICAFMLMWLWFNYILDRKLNEMCPYLKFNILSICPFLSVLL